MKTEAITVLFDSASGIYIPQRYANEIDHDRVSGVDPEDIAICRDGPDNENYWEAWEAILDNAEYTENGHIFTLHQDGDVFAVCPELMSPDEYTDFYGESPDSDWWANYAESHNLALYTLPSYWASYLINGDASGLEDGEQKQIDEFWDGEKLGHCVDVSREPWFSHANDATNLGGDVCYYLFEQS